MAIDREAVIRQQGAQSYFECKGDYRNPYPGNTPEHNDFERGWSQALRKSDARLVKVQAEGEPTEVKAPLASSENLYAAIKGRSR